MTCVQGCHSLVDLHLDRAVAFEFGAGRNANLHESQLAAKLGPSRKNPIESREPFRNSFCVIEPVDADPEDWRAKAECVDQALLLRNERWILRHSLDSI